VPVRDVPECEVCSPLHQPEYPKVGKIGKHINNDSLNLHMVETVSNILVARLVSEPGDVWGKLEPDLPAKGRTGTARGVGQVLHRHNEIG